MTAFDIEEAIETLFTETSVPFTFKKIDIQKLPISLTRPGMTVAATAGNFSSLDMSATLKEECQIVILVVFKNVAKEKERRREAHPAVRYVISKLQGNDLDLPIEPILVKNWRETTSPENLDDGLLLVEVTLTTAMTMKPEIEETEYRQLESIWASYQMNEESDSTVSSLVKFNNGNGEGNA